MLCTVEHCDRPHLARGLCSAHYQRWQKRSRQTLDAPIRQQRGRTCTIKDCDRPHLARGYCSLHWGRWRRTGDPATPGRCDWDEKCVLCSSDGPFYKRDRTCKKCRNALHKLWNETHLERRRKIGREFQKRSHQQRRTRVIAAYGGKCVCCGETELAFLTMDHMNGGGNAHRRSGVFHGTVGYYRWLEINSYPEGFQVLCHNCNFAKSHGGCPHGNC